MSKVVTTPISDISFVSGVNLSDASLSEVDLGDAETLLAQLISDRFPKLDFASDGTYAEFFIRPGVIPYLISRRMIETFRETMSLKGIEDNPALADPVVVSRLLSNHLISQNTGTMAVGEVAIQVATSRTYQIPEGAVFTTSDGLEFVAQTSITAAPVPSEDEVPLFSLGGGLFMFLVPVVAAEVGGQYNVAKGTEFTLSISIRDLVLCSAHKSFTRGVDGEGFADIRRRILAALSARNLVSHNSIYSTLKDGFANLVCVNCLGIGNPLLFRSRRTLIGNPVGGVVDVYVRTADLPPSVYVEKVATLVAGTVDTYTCKIYRNEAPGHYFVRGVRPVTGGYLGTYPIISATRTINNVTVGSDGREKTPNLIDTVLQGTYSRWQETTLQFRVASSDAKNVVDGGISVSVELFCAPDIQAIQEVVSANNTRVGGTDYLVRAFVPCMVTLSELRVRTNSSAVVTESMVRAAVMGYVNRLSAGVGVRVDGIVSSVTSIPGVKSVDLPITVSGDVYCPDAEMTVRRYVSTSNLEIPLDETLGTGPENTAFFLEAEQIPVSISDE